MQQATKCCRITVHLLNGTWMEGNLHVPMRTSSCVRPSDALRSIDDGFISLTEVTVHGDDDANNKAAVMVRMDAVGYVDLSNAAWGVRQRSAALESAAG